MSFGDESKNVFDFSARGQLCFVTSDRQTACSANLLDTGLDFTALDTLSINAISADQTESEMQDLDEN